MAETIRGGGSAGPSRYWGYRASWPLASLTVDFDAITLYLFPMTYRIEKERIRHLAVMEVIFFKQLLILHDKEALPRWLVFAPLNFAPLQSALERHGYRVQPEGEIPAAAEEGQGWDHLLGTLAVAGAVLGIGAAIYAALRRR